MLHHAVRRLGALLGIVTACAVSFAQQPADIKRSPVNQVFQFKASASSPAWNDGAHIQATAYLWIPEHARRLRGLMIMGTNVPEQMLAGDERIRAIAAKHQLAIVWSSPTFWYSRSKNEDKATVAFLQQLLNQLAKVSGYSEVATVPWLPIGESGHLLMVDALVEAAPERCIAGIWLKNPHLPPHNRTVPAFVIFGTAQEWGQDKADFETIWKNTNIYDRVLEERKVFPEWPLTFLLDPTSGHFDVSSHLVDILVHYIDIIVPRRVPATPSQSLHPIVLQDGYLASLSTPQHPATSVIPYAKATTEDRTLPWFPDQTLAINAVEMANVPWTSSSQLIGFRSINDLLIPFNFNGISSLVPTMEPDGISFHLEPYLLQAQPQNFFHSGQSLAVSGHEPGLEWTSGAVEPAGMDTFRFAMDRSYPQQAIYYVARVDGNQNTRAAVQPIAIKIQANKTGSPQTIAFQPIHDVSQTKHFVRLHAVSSSGLPVRFFVVAGPAMVEGNQLRITQIPANARFPVEVTVTAWQWGRAGSDPTQTAPNITQTFRITR